MYEANSPKELKKLLKENKLPILVKDRKTQKIVKTMESLKKNFKPWGAVKNVGKAGKGLSEKAILIIVGIVVSAGTFISLYALYKKMNIEVEFTKNGVIIRAKSPDSKDS